MRHVQKNADGDSFEYDAQEPPPYGMFAAMNVVALLIVIFGIVLIAYSVAMSVPK